MKTLTHLIGLLAFIACNALAQQSGTGINASAFGFLPGATAAVNAAALNKIITSTLCTAGCEITIPQGVYAVAADTVTFPTPNITLTGAGSAMGYAAPNAGTNIVFAAGTVGFDLTAITGGGGSGNYTTLRNMSISCNAVCAYPIKANGMVLLEHLNVTGSTAAGAGIWLFDFINTTKLSHVSAVGNLGYGLLIGGTGTTNKSTPVYIDHFVARSNLVGVRIEQARNLSMRDSIIESNTHEGMQIYRPTGNNLNNLSFDTVWFENNWIGGGAANYNVTIDAQGATLTNGPTTLLFKNCEFNASGATSAINVIAAYKMRVYDSAGAGAITLGTNATGVSFYNQNGGTITDTGNHNWIGYDELSMTEGGGPYFSGLNAGHLTIEGGGNVTLAVPNNTATPVYALNSSNQMRYYIVFAKVRASTLGAAGYSAYAIIAADTTTKILTQVDGTNLFLTVVALNVLARQTSLVPQDIEVSVLPIFQVF